MVRLREALGMAAIILFGMGWFWTLYEIGVWPYHYPKVLIASIIMAIALALAFLALVVGKVRITISSQ